MANNTETKNAYSDVIAAAPAYIDAFGAPMTGRPYIIFNRVPGAKSYIFRIEWIYKNKLVQAGSSFATYEVMADEALEYPAPIPKSNFTSHCMWYLPVFDANYAIPRSAQVYTRSFNDALSPSQYMLNFTNIFGDYYNDLNNP